MISLRRGCMDAWGQQLELPNDTVEALRVVETKSPNKCPAPVMSNDLHVCEKSLS